MNNIQTILDQIDAFQPNEREWIDLEGLLDKLWETNDPEEGIDHLFGVFERFPEDDGEGVFWSIVHGIESLNNYESNLIDSLNRQPSHIGLVMVKRIQNSGQTKVANVKVIDVYKLIIDHKLAPTSVLLNAEKYLSE